MHGVRQNIFIHKSLQHLLAHIVYRPPERRQEKAKGEAGAGAASVEGTPAPGSATPSINGAALPATHHDPANESGMDIDGPPLTQGGDKDATGAHSSAHMPTKRYRLTERMKNIIWELVVLSNESCRIENEKK